MLWLRGETYAAHAAGGVRSTPGGGDRVAGRPVAAGQILGRIVSVTSTTREPQELHATAQRAATPRRLSLRQGQRRVDSRQVQGVGLGRRNRAVRRAVPDSEGAAARGGGADEVHRQGGGRGAARR